NAGEPRDAATVAKAISACQEFLASTPPGSFAAIAHYALGLLLAQNGDGPSAAENLNTLLRRYPDAEGESGLPLKPLAEFKLFELSQQQLLRGDEPMTSETLCSNLVTHPCAISGYLLQQVGGMATKPEDKQIAIKWQWIWQQQDSVRRLFLAAQQQFGKAPSSSSSFDQLPKRAVSLPSMSLKANQGLNELPLNPRIKFPQPVTDRD